MINNILFVIKTFLIVGYNWLVYCYKNNYNEFIMNTADGLSKENIFYGKMFQCISVNTSLTDEHLSKYLLKYTNNVKYTNEDIDYYAIRDLKYFSDNKNYDMKSLKDIVPVNSGLISLIYRVKLNNEEVIIKLKRKNILKKFNEAFDNISFLINLTRHIKSINRLNIHRIFYENKKLLLEQLDFTKEVENIKLFQRKYKNVNHIIIPKVYEEFTNVNENVIVMEYIDGKDISELTIKEKDIYSTMFVNFALKSFLFDGIYHADMHPGNIIFVSDHLNQSYKLGVIDYGLIGKLSREEQNLFYLFVSSLISKKYEECVRNIIILMTEKCDHNNVFDINENLLETYANDKTLIDSIKEILINVNEINKKFTVNDLVKLNNLLNKYDIQLTSSFSTVQLAMAVCESTNESLCVNKTIIECFQEEAKKMEFF